jgi:hypothetical protein
MTVGAALLVPSVLGYSEERHSSTWLGATKVPLDARRIMLPTAPPANRPVRRAVDVQSELAIRELGGPVVALRNVVTHHQARVPSSTNLQEHLFDARVNLKVVTSQYAMHLSESARSRLFSELDYLLAEDGWDPDDTLPTVESFRVFLKWVIFSGDCTWSSLGIADDGNILAAWVRADDVMTANFGERVRWTQRFSANGSRQTVSGDFSLEHFARQASNFLMDSK